jgi:hypothetical protein
MRCWAILLILTIPFVLAEPTLNFQHEDTQPGETIFATIETTGEFTKSILDSDIKFYEGRKEVFIEHGTQFYGGKQYFYAYTTREGNFTIKIDNILYKELGQLKASILEKNFSVVKMANSSILSIKPGVLLTSTEPKLKMTNKGEFTLNITIGKESFSIEPVRSYEVTLDPKEIFSLLTVSTYKDFQVPIIFLGLNGSLNQTIEKNDLRANFSSLTFNLIIGNTSEKVVDLYNFGEDNLTDLKSLTSLNFLKIGKLSDVPPRGILNVTFTLAPETAGHFSDNFTIEYEQNGSEKKLVIPIDVYILPRGSTAEDFNFSDETCEGLNGSLCLSNETCDGETTFAKNRDYCCLGSCIAPAPNNSNSGFGWMIGVLILVVLGLIGYSLYKKQKKVTPPTPQQTITQSVDNYSQRISGGVQRS